MCAELVPGMNKYSSILKVGSSAGGVRAKKVIARVREAIAEWERFAAEAEVKDEFTVKISNRLKA